MSELLNAAKGDKKALRERKERQLEKERDEMRNIDLEMKAVFCPLIDGDCRGIRCSMFDPNYENRCNVVNFVNYVCDEFVGLNELLKKIAQKL